LIDELILVRHGETVHNVAGIAQGWNDSELSVRGLAQVERLAVRLQSMHVSAIYCSSLQRAITTGERIASPLGLELQLTDDLREMGYGSWEGRSFLDVRRNDYEIYRRWIDDADGKSPGGESHNDVRQRIESFIDALPGAWRQSAEPAAVGRITAAGVPADDATPAGRAVVVTHGTAIRIAATVLLRLPVMASRNFAQNNASINIFAWRGDRFVLKLWNDMTHCAGL
jgi:broad specificity phosphatase PhoE